jgi:hypothetical protein
MDGRNRHCVTPEARAKWKKSQERTRDQARGMIREMPEACSECGVKPVVRRACGGGCGLGEVVIEHVGHYHGREVIQCCGCKQRARGKGKNVTTPEMAKKAAQLLAGGKGPFTALREAGFPRGTYARGSKGINKMVRAELKTLGRKYIEIGRQLTAQDQEAMVRGRLAENVIIGTDKGVMSAKQLGADKRISMWQADSQVGVVVLQGPEVRQIKHEVEILPPSRFEAIERKHEEPVDAEEPQVPEEQEEETDEEEKDDY